MEAEKTKKARKPRKQPMLFKQTKKKELNAPTIGQAHRIKRGKTNEHNRNCTD